jgi:hypothetical protein
MMHVHNIYCGADGESHFRPRRPSPHDFCGDQVSGPRRGAAP